MIYTQPENRCLLLSSHVRSPLGVEEVDGDTKQENADIDAEQDHKCSQIVECVNHRNNSKGSAERNYVLDTNDNDQSWSGVLGECFGAEMGGGNQNNDEGEFVESPACVSSQFCIPKECYPYCLPMIIPQDE